MKSREMIALEKAEFKEKIKAETKGIFIVLVISVILFKIIFYREGIVSVVRTVASLYWIFVLPGFYLMYAWAENLKFLERVIIGIVLNTSLIGISSYYLGILGLHTKFHMIVLPAAILIISFIIIGRKFKKTGMD